GGVDAEPRGRVRHALPQRAAQAAREHGGRVKTHSWPCRGLAVRHLPWYDERRIARLDCLGGKAPTASVRVALQILLLLTVSRDGYGQRERRRGRGPAEEKRAGQPFACRARRLAHRVVPLAALMAGGG